MFSCCKSSEVENQIQYNTSSQPQYEAMRLKLLEHISDFNKELNQPKIYVNGEIFMLNYSTMVDVKNSPYLFKEIVIDHYRNNLLKTPESLLIDLESVCQVVKFLQENTGEPKKLHEEA